MLKRLVSCSIPRRLALSLLLAGPGCVLAETTVAEVSTNVAARVAAPGNYAQRPEVAVFVEEMSELGFSAAELAPVFADARYQQAIVDAISRPAERVLTWKEYQDIFLTERRLREGLAFMQTHADVLAAAETVHGVAPAIITAIIGVETLYGAIKGSYRVIDALSTLAFDYPPRSKFFRSELKAFLQLAREESLDPLEPVGSYAGAMGYGQFISSSYRHYAIDFDGDGFRDIWNNPADAIGSVANYLARHGWRPREPVTQQVERVASALPLFSPRLKPSVSVSQLRTAGIAIAETRPNPAADGEGSAWPLAETLVSPFEFHGKQGPEYWLGFNNFYAITRYNHSKLYAMAVFQLSQQLAKGDRSDGSRKDSSRKDSSRKDRNLNASDA